MAGTEVALRVKYTKSRDYRIVHSDGAMGGMTPRGDFRLEFIVTLPPEITSEEITVAADGKVTSKGMVSESAALIRERQVCVVMSPQSAKSLSEWLSEQVAGNA